MDPLSRHPSLVPDGVQALEDLEEVLSGALSRVQALLRLVESDARPPLVLVPGAPAQRERSASRTG